MSEMDIVQEGDEGSGRRDEDFVEPVALLMDDLKSEDTAIRVESIRRLRTICLALGGERTRNELIPFLQSSLDEEDEVLTALAEEMSSLCDGVGGPSQVHCLIPLMEGLVSLEETFVRTKAVENCSQIISQMPMSQLTEYIIPFLKRLAEGDWFSKKTSMTALSVNLIEYLLGKSADDGEVANLITEIVQIFCSVMNDDSPLVRKSLAVNLVKLTSIMNETFDIELIVSVCLQLASDPQDSVRLLAAEPIAALMNGIFGDMLIERLVPVFLSLASESSWRIRFMIANHFGKFAQKLCRTKTSANIDILAIYCALLCDTEAEVRSAACSQLTAVCSVLQPVENLQEQILESLELLLNDPSPHVRASLALQFNDLTRVLGPEKSSSRILPMILHQLRDESSEVRLNVISKLDVVLEVLGIEKLSASLIPAIVDLAEDRQWRVRQTIIEYIPELAAHLGKDFFDQKLSEMLIGWLDDPVFAVRQCAIESIRRIIKDNGNEWAVDSGFLEKLLSLSTHRNYLRRVILLMTLSETCSAVNDKTVISHYLPTLEKMVSDPIANVRLNVAKTLESVIPVIVASHDSSSVINNRIIPLLQQLQRDGDSDVQEHAERSLHLVPVH